MGHNDTPSHDGASGGTTGADEQRSAATVSNGSAVVATQEDEPVPVALTEKAIRYFAGQSVEVRDKTDEEELWAVTRVTIHIGKDGVIPCLPPIIRPIPHRHYFDARKEAARVLGLDPQDILMALVEGRE
jgi:hypothetical protein